MAFVFLSGAYLIISALKKNPLSKCILKQFTLINYRDTKHLTGKMMN